AYANIFVNARLTSSDGGAITLRADNTGTGNGTVTFGGHANADHFVPADIFTPGTATVFYNPSSYATPTPFSSHLSGGGTLSAYMLVNTVVDLQNIQTNLSGNYALGRNIDASATANWNGGAGFAPIGNSKASFAGIFDGQGLRIDGLTIAPTDPGVTNIGLFG